MNLRSLLVCIWLLAGSTVFSQTEMTFDQYHLMGHQQPYLFMPVIHYRNAHNWYAEARYNYEDLQTVSLFLGKAFTGDKEFSYSLVPMFGASVGRFTGLSAGLNVDLEYNKFYFSTQSQYSLSTKQPKEYFLYSWSEAGYQPLNWLYAGVSVQQTHDRYTGDQVQPGLLVGFSFSRFTLPVYAFDPLSASPYFIVGVSFQWKKVK